MNYKLFVQIASVFFTFSVAPLIGKSAPTKLQGAVLDISPWGFRDKKIDGIHPRLLKAIENNSRLRFEYQLTPVSRVVAQLKDDTIDFSILVRRIDMGKNIEGLGVVEDLSQFLLKSPLMRPIKKIGLIRGDKSLFNQHLNSKFKSAEVEELTHFTSLFRMLQAGRLDAVFYSGNTFERFLVADKVARGSFAEPELLQTIKVEFLVSKKNSRFSAAKWEEIKIQISKSIEELKKSGVLASIHHAFNEDLKGLSKPKN